MRLGSCLQRLFSTFPDGGPVFGLLLLRFGAGIALISFGADGLFGEVREPVNIAPDLIGAVAGVGLLAGLWTPLMGALAAIDLVPP